MDIKLICPCCSIKDNNYQHNYVVFPCKKCILENKNYLLSFMMKYYSIEASSAILSMYKEEYVINYFMDLMEVRAVHLFKKHEIFIRTTVFHNDKIMTKIAKEITTSHIEELRREENALTYSKLFFRYIYYLLKNIPNSKLEFGEYLIEDIFKLQDENVKFYLYNKILGTAGFKSPKALGILYLGLLDEFNMEKIKTKLGRV